MIIIGTATRGEVLATFTYDLIQLLKHSPEAVWGFSSGSYISNNRIAIVRQALETNAGHILFLDSDMRFPADTLQRLLLHDKDIIGANYKQRTQEEWTARKDGKFIGKGFGLGEVDTLGLGVTLIKRAVFEKFEPWFAMPYDPQEKKQVGEDVYFCTMAKQNGFKIWVDHDLSHEVKHTGTVEL